MLLVGASVLQASNRVAEKTACMQQLGGVLWTKQVADGAVAQTQRCHALSKYLAGPSSSMGVGSCTLIGTCMIVETVKHRQQF